MVSMELWERTVILINSNNIVCSIMSSIKMQVYTQFLRQILFNYIHMLKGTILSHILISKSP